MAKPIFNLDEAHKHSTNNVGEIKSSVVAGCFHCDKIFSPIEINDFTDNETALCPYCGIAAVIGNESGFYITPDFLAEMKNHWFGKK